MHDTQELTPPTAGRRKQSGRIALHELIAPWEEFRRVIPLVALDSLLANRNPACPKVAVLMCTMQGQRFLAQQLNSVATQSHARWTIWASDDGSADHTQAILE